jgi:hypothetical protein
MYTEVITELQGGKEILEDLQADGDYKMPEQDLMDLVHEVRRITILCK